MGIAYEAVNTYGTGNAALLTLPHVADPLSTLAIRASNGQPSARLQCVWCDLSEAADITIHSPRMHDDVIALELRGQIGVQTPISLLGLEQPLYSQDVLIVQSTYAAAPAAAAAENVGYIVWYDDLPGATARLKTWAQVKAGIKQYLGVKFTADTGAVAGQYGVPVAINATQDYFKANSDYALLGYTLSVACATVGLVGADTSNYIVGGPGSVDPLVTRDWYLALGAATGKPCIPVINSANRQATNILVAGPTAATAVTGELLFAYLGDTTG